MPASTDFNPRTAYREDWRYVDGAEDGVLMPFDVEGKDLDRHVDIKMVVGAVDHPTLIPVAAGMRVRTAQFTVWLTNYEADEPVDPFRIRRAGNVDWVIHKVTDDPFGKFFCLCSLIGKPEVANAL